MEKIWCNYPILYILNYNFNLYVFSSRSKSKGKLVSNGHTSPAKKEKSHSCSPKNDVTMVNEEKTINSITS